MATAETWYRFDTEVDEYGGVSLYRSEFDAVKKTPCGVWLVFRGGWQPKRRFVLLNSRKKYAHPDIDSALQSFIARKNLQLRILSARHDQTAAALEMAALRLEELRAKAA